MQKYVIAKFLAPIADGTEFDAKHWPLHVTLAGNFAVDRKTVGLFEKLSDLAANEQPITAVAGDDDYFGPQGQVQVTTLDMAPELQALHNHVITLLKDVGATFDAPQYQEAGYRAHATVQVANRLHEGDVVTIDDFTVIDMFPHDDIDRRRTMKTFKLGSRDG